MPEVASSAATPGESMKAALLRSLPTEAPPDTLAGMRRILGPFASADIVVRYGGSFPKDARKGANLYLRYVCELAEDNNSAFDFSPLALLRRAQDRAGNSAAASASPPPTCVPPWLELEVRLFPAAGFLSAFSLMALSVANQSMRRIVDDQTLWAETYAATFGEPCKSASTPPRGEEVSRGVGSASAYKDFVRQWYAVKERVCPMCQQKAIVPIVHGYPSAKLQALQRKGLCVLAENCGFLGPFWVCLRCHGEWDHYPFLSTSECKRRHHLLTGFEDRGHMHLTEGLEAAAAMALEMPSS